MDPISLRFGTQVSQHKRHPSLSNPAVEQQFSVLERSLTQQFPGKDGTEVQCQLIDNDRVGFVFRFTDEETQMASQRLVVEGLGPNTVDAPEFEGLLLQLPAETFLQQFESVSQRVARGIEILIQIQPQIPAWGRRLIQQKREETAARHGVASPTHLNLTDTQVIEMLNFSEDLGMENGKLLSSKVILERARRKLSQKYEGFVSMWTQTIKAVFQAMKANEDGIWQKETETVLEETYLKLSGEEKR